MRIGRANEFVSRSVLLFLLKLLGAVLGFLGSIFLGRNLGIAGLGQFEFVIALFNVVVILSFSGSGDALIKQVPRDSSYKRKLASLRYALRLRLTFFSRVALLVLAFFLLDTAFELGLSRFSYSMLAALILAIPFLYRDAMVSFMVALKENVLAQLFSDACSNAVRLAIFVGFFFLGNLYIGTALLAQVVAFFISSLFLFLALKKIFGVVSLRASNRLSLKFSAAAKDFWAASVFWHMMIYMDVLMLGVLVGDEAVGGYSVCLKVVQLLNYFVIVNNYIAGPQISEAFHNKKTVEIKGFVNTVILFMIFVATISVFLLSLFASDVLSFWGGGFEGFKAVLMVLVIGQAVNMVLNTHGVLLGMTEHSADLKRVYRTMLPINFIFNITLIPTMGVMGAAVSTSITLVLTNLSLAIMARRKVFGSVW